MESSLEDAVERGGLSEANAPLLSGDHPLKSKALRRLMMGWRGFITEN
jgi:hypothetical protein